MKIRKAKCHSNKKHYAKDLCQKCYDKNKKYQKAYPDRHRKSGRKYYRRNKETIIAKSRKWSKNNPERVKEIHKQWLRNNPERANELMRKANLKARYHCTLKWFDKLLKIQNYKCAICNKIKHSEKKKLQIDHNHKTNKNRGLLCHNCNRGLGHFKENYNYLRSAIKYLKYHGLKI